MFAEKLKIARKAARLSQKAMAASLAIPSRTIEEWEAGRRIPPEYVQRLLLMELARM
jgi:DNA-binding transcriptional regulator YiaG